MLYILIFLILTFWLTMQDYFSFPCWENTCFADLCWNVASSLFTGNVSENAVPSRQGNSLCCIWEHHLMLSSYLGVNLLFCGEFFSYIGPKERNNLPGYLHECVRVDNPVTKSVVNKCVIQICPHCRSCVSFVLVFVSLFVQDEFVGWSQQSEHQYQSTNDWEDATIKPLC